MNFTELARKLKVHPQELRDLLPQFGFDIGQKAIKVNNQTAEQILVKWPKLMKEWRQKKTEEELEKKEKNYLEKEVPPKEIKIQSFLTVRDFAARLDLTVSKVIAELMKNGILSTLNDRIDFETAAVIAEDLGFKVLKEEGMELEKIIDSSSQLKKLLEEEDKTKLKPRPPVVVVMGHVDHGKTKLLDNIRKANVVETEAGGITQHIGAYQVEKNSQIITFIDTPGHEAFTAIRSRGAKVADIAILVVAADDGIKPQTLEALKIIQAVHLPFIVAINKIDKPEANIEKIKQELAQQNLLPEDWGGKTICVPISAKTGEGLDNLLEMIILVADLEKEKITANPEKKAVGTIIESHIDKGEGPVATALIQSGTLYKNDVLSFDEIFYGKVRAMKDFRDKLLEKALPGMPVKISGFKNTPFVGDVLVVAEKSKLLKKKVRSISAEEKMISLKTPKAESSEEEELKGKLKIILKTDVLSSLEAILISLEKIGTQEVKVEVVAKGLGNITETDILKAEATESLVLGFNVLATPATKILSEEKKVEVKFYKIIYDLIKEVRERLEKLLSPEILKRELGKLQVLAIFRREKNSMILGGKVLEGFIEIDPAKPTKIDVFRGQKKITSGNLTQLQSGKEEVRNVEKSQEAGIKFQGEPMIEVNDILEFYQEEKRGRKL